MVEIRWANFFLFIYATSTRETLGSEIFAVGECEITLSHCEISRSARCEIFALGKCGGERRVEGTNKEAPSRREAYEVTTRLWLLDKRCKAFRLIQATCAPSIQKGFAPKTKLRSLGEGIPIMQKESKKKEEGKLSLTFLFF